MSTGSSPRPAIFPSGRQGREVWKTKQKNLADESGCKPLIRQDAYFFGVIASLPHIAYFSELTLPFMSIGLSLCFGNDRVGDSLI